MKTHLLLFLFLCASAAGMAQNQVQTLDTSFTSTDGGATYSLSQVSERTYDAACRIATQTYRYFNLNTHQLQSTTRYVYTYNANNTYDTTYFQVLDTAQNTFVNNSRDTRTYRSDGLIATVTSEAWNGSQWVPSGLETYQFTTPEQRTLYLQQRWDAGQQAYINEFRLIDDYNAGGKLMLESWQYWNAGTLVWDHRYDYSYAYDAGNFVVSDTFKTSDNFDSLTLVDYTTYSNNSKGYPNSSLLTLVIDTTTARSFYTYYPDSMVTAQVYRYNYDQQQNLTGITRTTDSYDSTVENVYVHRQTQAFANSYADPFITLFDDSYTAVYSPDKQLVSFEFSSTYNNPDGTPVYNNIFKDTLYYAPCRSVLPVSLLSFTANNNNNNAVLQWRTAGETNTAYFDVQRSPDGVHFTTIGTVKATGNGGESSYTYTDFNVNTLGASKLYYRLAQQDVSGSTHNSAIAQVDITNGKLSVTLSPNPVRNRIGIHSPVAMPDAVIRIADMSGRVVYATHTNLSAGTTFTIDASAFARGMYFVTVQSGTDKQVLKLVKE